MRKKNCRDLSTDEQDILDHCHLRLLTRAEDIAPCDQGILEHHYLHNVTLVGEHLRYGLFYKGRALAFATWSSAAFHLKDRDTFIGWSPEQCRRRRGLLANDSRLLVMPGCHSPNLISRFMKLMPSQLSGDWEKRWGHPIVLVETFVDPRFYQGTAYKVSGWSHLGRTAGWKRKADDFYEKNDAPKQIWVRELVKKACVKLRAAELAPDWARVEETVPPALHHQGGADQEPERSGSRGDSRISPGPVAGLSDHGDGLRDGHGLGARSDAGPPGSGRLRRHFEPGPIARPGISSGCGQRRHSLSQEDDLLAASCMKSMTTWSSGFSCAGRIRSWDRPRIGS